MRFISILILSLLWGCATLPEGKPTTGYYLDNMVRKVVKKRGTVFKAKGAATYEGYYNIMEDGCHKVTIIETIAPFNRHEAKHFKVCGDAITQEKVFSLMLYPHDDKTAEFFYQKAIEQAYGYGDEEIEYEAWTIRASVVGSRDSVCRNIEVVVLDDGYQIERKTVKKCPN